MDENFGTAWTKLYPLLRLLVRRLVHSFHVQSWRGQEDDIVKEANSVAEGISQRGNTFRGIPATTAREREGA